MNLISAMIGEKKQWRHYKARVAALPPPYRTTAEAVERYLMHAGGIAKGDVAVAMFGDLADLFEQGAAEGTSIRALVGEDPVEFVEEFLRNYADGSWLLKERARLVDAVARAAGETS